MTTTMETIALESNHVERSRGRVGEKNERVDSVDPNLYLTNQLDRRSLKRQVVGAKGLFDEKENLNL